MIVNTINDRLSLVTEKLTLAPENPVIPPVNHIVVVDCSYSMYSDLPELRRQLKNKLPTLVKERDTITILWFSSRGQFGVLQEMVDVRSAQDLANLNTAIDRFIVPTGATGFKEPLVEVGAIVDRAMQARPGSLFSLFFMSDGYDNQWSRAEILGAAQPLADKVAAATVVEYGWGADRDLLGQIAEVCGGNLVFSQHFPDYEATFEDVVSGEFRGGKKVVVNLRARATLGYAFSYDSEGNISTYQVSDEGEVLVPENLATLSYFSDYFSDVEGDEFKTDETLYVGLATLSQRAKANEIFAVLEQMGDVYLVNRFVNAFSKQDYTDFQNEVVQQGFDASQRFKSGVDKNAVPKEDAYTVLDLLGALTADPENKFYPRHEAFEYKRIGAGSEQKDDQIKFEYAEENPGVPISSITFNAARPNASVLVRFDGSVTLPADRAQYPSLPDTLPSFIFRNFTIIRDGIVHTRKLPLSLTAATLEKLQDTGLDLSDARPGELFVLDISPLPVINRKMVKEVSAKETFAKVYELERLKGDQKVYKHFRDQFAPKKSEAYAQQYGEDAAAWLKEIGVTDYNGFNPPSKTVPFDDVYTAKFLTIGVKGLSSLPKVEDVITKINSGKPLTLREAVMQRAIARVNAFMASGEYTGAADAEAALKTWIDGEARAAIDKTRALNVELAKTKFAIIVGHVWFTDLKPGEESLTLNVDGQDVVVNAKLEDKEIGGSKD